METLTTSINGTVHTYEAPVGKVVRATALGVAIGFSLLVGAMIVAQPDLALTPMIWFLWVIVTLASVLVYTVGSLLFRHSSQKPSRRTQRWLNHSG